MDPITVDNVSQFNLAMQITAGLIGLVVVLVIMRIIQEIHAARKNILYVGFGPLHLAGLVGIVAFGLFMGGISLYNEDLNDAANKAVVSLEQETGVSITNKSTIHTTDIIQENNSIAVSFNDDGKVYEGLLIIENWEMLLHIPNLAEADREMVVYGE